MPDPSFSGRDYSDRDFDTIGEEHADQLISFYARYLHEVPGVLWDPALKIMLLLKNSWSLTDSGLLATDLTFTTGWYDENIALPQIGVTPAYNRKSVMECGSTPLYQFIDTLFVNIWVRPEADTSKSYGSAKRKEYMIRKEVERILRKGSHIGDRYNNEEFMYIGKWRRLDEAKSKPIILRSMYEIKDNYYRACYEDV